MLGNSVFPNAPTIEELKDAATTSAPSDPESDAQATGSDSSESSTASVKGYVEDQRFIPWHLANGKCGQLHVAFDELTLCQRALKNPRIGIGLESARSSGAKWSPRCFSKLKEEHRRAWLEGD